jgi:branched-subunit amino acid aminotransferase/4-amino-4-deoxychorismate lyase
MRASEETVLLWSGDRLLAAERGAGGALLAADSWLVADGAVRALDAHWERFGGWCAELGVAPEAFAGFREAANAALPRDAGRWFPRVEAVAGAGAARSGDAAAEHPASIHAVGAPHLRLRLRPAPPHARSAHVILGAPGDPRTRPRWKGPDLDRLIGLRERAVASGADELLLRDSDGRLVEGALTSLLWWEDDALCTTPPERTLPGITRAVLLDRARRRGIAVRVRSPLPGELRDRETWLTSALHGIRVVEEWGPARRAPEWQAELEALAQPLEARR